MRRRDTLLCLIGIRLLSLRRVGAARAASLIGFGGPFSLTAGDGATITDRYFRGRFMLIFFGYTNCPDQCPLTLSSIAQAMAALGPLSARLAVLFVTIDPARDTPALTARYAALFSPAIIGLSGTPAQIARIIAAYHVYVGPRDANSGAIPHGDLLYLVGPNGLCLATFPGQLDPAALSQRLSHYLTLSS
jgi:protein SCO1/2